MTVPLNVSRRIERLETAMNQDVAERRVRKDAQDARKAAMADLNSRRETILALALYIFEWRDGAVRSKDARRMWSLIGGARIPLCTLWYWDGLPSAPENVRAECVCVSLDGPNHNFLLEEWRDGLPYREVGRPSSPLQLMEMAHPKLIEDLQTFLSGPESWEPIIEELNRRLALYGPG